MNVPEVEDGLVELEPVWVIGLVADDHLGFLVLVVVHIVGGTIIALNDTELTSYP